MIRLASRTGAVFFPLTIIARVPFAMMVVGVLTLVVAARGSVELGGITSAMVGLGVAFFGPLLGSAADRFGQRPVLLLTAAVNSVALGSLAWVAFSSLPDWVMLLGSFLAGASAPQTSPMSRSRLVTIIQSEYPAPRRPRAISSVLAFESAADEVVFVFGPVVVGLLATAFDAWVPIAAAAILTLLFVTAFAVHRTSVPPKSAAERAATVGPVAELRRASLLVTVFGIFAVGLFFGSMLTSLTAFMQDRGAAEQAGLFYGVMGVGSAALAIAAAWFSPKFTLRYRWLLFGAALATGTAILQTVNDVPGMLLSLTVMGLGIGPLLVTLYSFGAARTPAGRSATVMTMLGSGVIVGQSLASAVTGIVAEQLGTGAATLLPLAAAILVLLAGLINFALTPAGRLVRATGPVQIP
ncbi:MFS transporter [Leucobacter sp. W1153]|uniref:MFS transporter n=1 Tax=Leucobacter sp. W1153 TaxID=3439064 RepID=UPI003F2F2A7E